MSYFYLDAKEFDKVTQMIEKFSDRSVAEQIINDYLANEGGKKIKEYIRAILPVSGRIWNGKKAAASQTDPFRIQGENLAVKVYTKGNYHYLYFPDDGSNTRHHRGNQQFMFHGAEKAGDEIVNGVIDKLVKRLEET